MNEEIKQILLNKAEVLTRETIDCIFEIIEVLVKDSDTITDDLMVLPILPVIKEMLLKYVDEIA